MNKYIKYTIKQLSWFRGFVAQEDDSSRVEVPVTGYPDHEAPSVILGNFTSKNFQYTPKIMYSCLFLVSSHHDNIHP